VEMIVALSEETSTSLVTPLRFLMLSSKNKSATAYSFLPRTWVSQCKLQNPRELVTKDIKILALSQISRPNQVHGAPRHRQNPKLLRPGSALHDPYLNRQHQLNPQG
jgi:hypothetical protein